MQFPASKNTLLSQKAQTDGVLIPLSTFLYKEPIHSSKLGRKTTPLNYVNIELFLYSPPW